MKLEKLAQLPQRFFARKVPWWMKIVRPVVLASALLLGIDHLLLPALPGRPLTNGEVAMLTPIFRDAVDYNKVRVHNSGFGTAVRTVFRAGALTRGSLIIEGDNIPDYSAKNVPFFPRYQFTHEMTHVWQNQNGVSDDFSRLAKRTLAKLNPWDKQLPTYQYTLKGAQDLTDFSIEQQASIVPDYTYLIPHNVQSPLDADSYKEAGARKAAYGTVLKKFLADPKYPRHRK